MPLKYYPLTQIATNLYTKGGLYATPDGKEYRGRYYTTSDGSAFTGIDPILGTNIELIPIQQQRLNTGRGSITQNVNTENYLIANSNANAEYVDLDQNSRLEELRPYYPIPIQSDYERGYFTRYFAKTVSGPGYVFEISQNDWSLLQEGLVADNVLGYESVDMLWQLTGPLNDTRVSQYQIKGGVFDTNKRVTETKNKVFRGLLEFIGGDYTKFARITP